MAKITFLLFVTLISGCASRTPPPRLWDAASIADHPNSIVVFKSKTKGKAVAGVYTGDIKNMIRIKDQVEKAAGPMRVLLLVEESEEPNGFSVTMHGQPIIAINIGMINLLGKDSDAMAALVGHELAHLYLEHGNQQQLREGNRVITSALLSFTLGMIGIPTPVGVTDAATTAVSRSYSREDEREADRLGVLYMTQAQFDAFGAVRLHEKLRSVAKGSMLPFMSTHPSGDERVENMKRLAMEMTHKQAEDAPPTDRGQ